VTVVLTTLTTWSIRAGVNPHIVEVDLDIDYLAADDPTEWTPGGFVCVEGRRKITLQKVQPADWGTTAGDSTKRVRLSWGSTKIAIYDAATGGNAVISGTDYANANLPTNFWVEGVAVSATAGTSSTPGPETILAQAIPDGMYDRISFTVYQVDSITVMPKNAPEGWTPPVPVTIGAGAIHSSAHQADVTIQVQPTVAGIPIDVSLSGGLSYEPGKAAELTLGTQAATGGCAVVTVLTGTNGTITGELTSSDVNNMECTIHACATETTVVFTWDKYPEQDQWTFEPGYLPVPGVLTNHLVLRHHRDGADSATTNGMPWQPFNGHDIRFFVEKVEYWDADGNLCETNNTATAPADVSAWATFPTNPVTTDANGRVTELLTIVTNANLFSVTLAAYDTSVYREAATPPPALLSKLSPSGVRGGLKPLAAQEESPVAERTKWVPPINIGDSAYKVTLTEIKGMRKKTVGDFSQEPDAHAPGRLFIDTTETWLGGALNSHDRQRVKITVVVVKPSSIPLENFRIRWEVRDPDDLATDNEIDADGRGGDNTGRAHEWANYWFTQADHPIGDQNNPGDLPPGNPGDPDPVVDENTVIGTAKTELAVDGVGTISSTVFFNFSDDGGDNFVIKAILVKNGVDLYEDQSKRLTVWRKRNVTVFAMDQDATTGGANWYPGADLAAIQATLNTGYANADANKNTYIDIVASNATDPDNKTQHCRYDPELTHDEIAPYWRNDTAAHTGLGNDEHPDDSYQLLGVKKFGSSWFGFSLMPHFAVAMTQSAGELATSINHELGHCIVRDAVDIHLGAPHSVLEDCVGKQGPAHPATWCPACVMLIRKNVTRSFAKHDAPDVESDVESARDSD
jgi:hypothetical protein